MKKEPVRLIVDLNAVLNAALLGGKDPDGVFVTDEDGQRKQINSALYGVERFFDYLAKDMEQFGVAPRNVIGVWDGVGAKDFRRIHLPGYKAGRNKSTAVHEQLTIAREMLAPMMRHVGITVCSAKAREADDVIAYLVKTLRDVPNFVSTVDGDLCALVDANTHVWRNGKLNENPYGQFPHRHITLYKTLVGDTGDKIPGAKGFGDAAFVDLIRIFGVEALDDLMDHIANGKIPSLRDNISDFPKMKLIVEQEEQVTRSYHCARLYPDEVNTVNRPLEWVPAMVKTWAELPEEQRIPQFKRFYGTKTLVTGINYMQAKRQAAVWVEKTPFVALDIETSSSNESDAWLDQNTRRGGGSKIDALGHELTGMSLTFGDNCQHTIYMSVDHADTPNITVDQCREMVEVFDGVRLVCHNNAFEFQVLYRTWGDEWKDNGWHGFLPNCMDTIIEASYVDENLSRGLKFRSKTHLGYEQQTYEDVTTMEGPPDVIPFGGMRVKDPFQKEIAPAVYKDVIVEREFVDEDTGEVSIDKCVEQELVTPAVVETWERRQYKMRELTGQRVLNYGCDDTICTAWLHNWFYLVMLLENTWHIYEQVEILPQYLTSLAYVQGTPMNLGRLNELEKEDQATYEKNWAVIRDFLFTKGWAGTSKPVFEVCDVKAIKEAMEIVCDEEYTTRKKKPNAVAAEMRETYPDNENAQLLANILEAGDVSALNDIVARHFTGEPKINFNSPRQIQKLLYEVIGMTPRIYNKLTEKERANDEMREAFAALRKINDGKVVAIKDEWRAYWMKKSSTDDQAVDLALAKDDLGEVEVKVLKAYLKVKEIQTRMNMFYTAYKSAMHWRDGFVHPELNQCATVTRRYTSGNPNIQQVPGKGDGAKIRTVFMPHHKDAVFVSVDLTGQELRGLAHACQDPDMLSCYLGDKPRDIHSLVAVQAAPFIWRHEVTYEEFMAMRKSSDKAVADRASALRSHAKTCVFGSNYGAQAPNLALQLKTDEETAQKFLDALDAAFPRIKKWKEEVNVIGADIGYSKTFLGARRHLATALRANDKWDVMRAERQLGNAVIQGSGAEQLKLAMSKMWSSDLFFRYDAHFFAPIHDEVCASVHRDQAVDFILEMHATMIQPYGGMSVPAASSLALGRDFSCPLEVGENPTRESVKAAIEKLFEGDV